ncbi:MAG TPA: o-succinylbenzoate synthase [Psychromonas sp.]
MPDTPKKLRKPIFQQAKIFSYLLSLHKPMLFKGIELSAREGLILQLENVNGQFHYAEIAPLPGFSKETLIQAFAQIKEVLINYLLNKNANKNIKDLNLYPSVHFAVDCILNNIPISTGLNKPANIPLLQGDNQSVLEQYRQLNNPQRIKVKVARQKVTDDILLFNALSAINKNLLIRCDANQGWRFSQASLFFANINNQLIDFIEEPTASATDNIKLAKHYAIHLALDETLQQSHFQYQHESCFKALILKPTLIGSFERLDYFIEIAKKQHLQVSISSSFESPLGLTQLAFLASQWSKEVAISYGLDTLKFFKSGTVDMKRPLDQQVNELECLWTSN